MVQSAGVNVLNALMKMNEDMHFCRREVSLSLGARVRVSATVFRART